MSDTVLHRVLDERLQDEVGDERRACVRGDVPLDPESIAVAHLLDLDVAAHEPQLLVERQVDRSSFVEQIPQQLTEPDERVERLVLPVAPHEHRDGVQRIEQEVRLQLRLERGEARALELRLELRRAEIAVAVAVGVVEPERHRQHAYIYEEVVRQQVHHTVGELLPVCDMWRNVAGVVPHHERGERLSQEQRDDHAEVEQHDPGPRASRDGAPAVQREDDRRERDPDVPGREAVSEDMRRGHSLAAFDHHTEEMTRAADHHRHGPNGGEDRRPPNSSADGRVVHQRVTCLAPVPSTFMTQTSMRPVRSL